MSTSVVYKNVRLTKGSKALELWEAAQKDPKLLQKLDLHMRELDDNEKALLKRYKGSPDFHVDSFLAMYSLRTDFRVERAS